MLELAASVTVCGTFPVEKGTGLVVFGSFPVKVGAVLGQQVPVLAEQRFVDALGGFEACDTVRLTVRKHLLAECGPGYEDGRGGADESNNDLSRHTSVPSEVVRDRFPQRLRPCL